MNLKEELKKIIYPYDDYPSPQQEVYHSIMIDKCEQLAIRYAIEVLEDCEMNLNIQREDNLGVVSDKIKELKSKLKP